MISLHVAGKRKLLDCTSIMKNNESKTKVVFLKFPQGDIIAMFPEIPGTNKPGDCLSYQHTGQHGAASTELLRELQPATPEEYAPLKSELENHFDYHLEVIDAQNAAVIGSKQWVFINCLLIAEEATNAHVETAKRQPPRPDCWTPWKCSLHDDIETTLGIALNKFLRDSGYLTTHPIYGNELRNRGPLAVQVSYYDESTPLHPSGRPKRYQSVIYMVHPNTK